MDLKLIVSLIMSKVTIASLLFIFIGHVLGQIEDIGSKSPDEEITETTDRDIYDCYHKMHCKLGVEGREMAGECHSLLTDEDWKYMWQWYDESGYPEFVNKKADELTDMMCPMDDEVKKEIFDKIAGKLTRGLSEECTRNAMGYKCKHGNDLMQCFGDKIEELKIDRKCGFGTK